MMTHCFASMAGFGPGWTLILIAATAAATYLLTKRSGQTAGWMTP
jgi:UPF0716 family protein affecting phage T7 exclusion